LPPVDLHEALPAVLGMGRNSDEHSGGPERASEPAAVTDNVTEIGSISNRLRAMSRQHDLTVDDLAAANRLLTLLVDCLTVQRDHGITPEAERFAYAALADFIRRSP
jgi:hypothetical protein